MYFWIVNCSLAFLLCVLCASIVIPQILLIAFRKQLFDLPDERKIHVRCHDWVVSRSNRSCFSP